VRRPGGGVCREGATEDRIERGLLNAVDDELTQPRERMPPDYEAPNGSRPLATSPRIASAFDRASA
jgi:hypothetical protein